MAAPVVERSQQRLVCALLVAIGALVLPLSGAVVYFDLANGSDSLPALFPFTGAANASDVLGPVLLVSALALGIVVTRHHVRSAELRRAIALMVVVAASTQGVAFFVSAVDVAVSHSYAIPQGLAWQSAKWLTVARLLSEGIVCAAVLVSGVRWLGPAVRKETW